MGRSLNYQLTDYAGRPIYTIPGGTRVVVIESLGNDREVQLLFASSVRFVVSSDDLTPYCQVP